MLVEVLLNERLDELSGIVIVQSSSSRIHVLFGCIPLLLAVQQYAKGVLWLALSLLGTISTITSVQSIFLYTDYQGDLLINNQLLTHLVA
ncbi:hypothetical protein ABDJ41_19330 [Pedobacter sp. ASV1-7]